MPRKIIFNPELRAAEKPTGRRLRHRCEICAAPATKSHRLPDGSEHWRCEEHDFGLAEHRGGA